MNFQKNLSITLLSLFIAISIPNIKAEAQTPSTSNSCFGYASLEQIETKTEINNEYPAPSEVIEINSTIRNNSEITLVDSDVYLRIYKTTDNNPLLIEEIILDQDKDFKKSEVFKYKTNWEVPTNVIDGKYYSIVFVDSGNKIGPRITSNILIGNKTYFTINSDIKKQNVYLDKNRIGLTGNNKEIPEIGNITTAEQNFTGDAGFYIDIKNESETDQDVKVIFELFNRNGYKVDTKTENYTATANNSIKARYDLTDDNFLNYVLKATLEDASGNKQITRNKIDKKGSSDIFLNSIGLNKNIILKDTSTDVFACVSGLSSNTETPTLQTQTTIASDNGEIIFSSEDQIDPNQGLVATFTPEKNYANFSLNIKLFENDKLVDEVNQTYSNEEPAPVPTSSNSMILIISIIVVLIIIVVLVAIKRNKPEHFEGA